MLHAHHPAQIILLGDSAVGKSKLVERYLMDNYHPRQRSTYALTLYRHEEDVEEEVGEGEGTSAAAAAGGGSSSSSGSGSAESAAVGGAAGAGAGAVEGGAGGAGSAGSGGGRKRKRRVAVDFWDTAGQERFASMHASYYYRAHACVLVFDVTRKVTYTNLQAWYKELRQFCPNVPCICIANKIDVDYAVTNKAFAFPDKHGLPFFFVSAADGTNVVAIFQEAVRLAWAYKTRGEKDFVEEVLELIDDVRPLTRARAHIPTSCLVPSLSRGSTLHTPHARSCFNHGAAEGSRCLWKGAVRPAQPAKGGGGGKGGWGGQQRQQWQQRRR